MGKKNEKGLTILAVLVALLGIQLSLAVSRLEAVDSPHNLNNHAIDCESCHRSGPVSSTWWTDQEANVCAQTCHSSGGYKDVVTHKVGTTKILAQCTMCHDPHNQMQSRTYPAIPGNTQSFLYTSTCTSADVTSSTLLKSGATWTENYWTNYYLIPNTKYRSVLYRILSNTADTITIDQQTGGE